MIITAACVLFLMDSLNFKSLHGLAARGIKYLIIINARFLAIIF